MNKEKAIYFAGLMEFYLNIPSFICEDIEKYLIDENYKQVIEFIINRTKELKEQEKDIKHQMEMIYKQNIKYKEVLDKIKEKLHNSKEYKMAIAMELNKEQSILIDIDKLLEEIE